MEHRGSDFPTEGRKKQLLSSWSVSSYFYFFIHWQASKKICAKRLEYYFWRIGLFDEDQEGFTRARNTVRYLNRLNLGIKTDLEKRLTVMCLFLDMKKAFDSVWKRGLIVKLSQVGVKGRMLAIIDAFLMNRSVRLNVNGFIGILRLCLLIGLPQGSVLSPILFKFFLYDLCEEFIRSNYRLLKKYKFADDGSLKASGATTAICLENLMLIMGGGQPNSTQFMPMPILRFECGIGINWHKLAHFL